MINIEVFLSSAVIGAIISGLTLYIHSRKEWNLQYITGERKEWREKIRNIASELQGADDVYTLKLLAELKVRINAFGNTILKNYHNDSHIWELIHQIEENGQNSHTKLLTQQKLMIEYLSLLLKYDWDRSKNEVNGDKYKTVGFIMFFLSTIFFVESIYYFNESNKFTIFELQMIVFMYIIFVIVAKFAFERFLESILSMLNCKMNERILKDKFFPLYVFYFFILVGFIGLSFIHVHVIFGVFKGFKNDISAYSNIMICCLSYTFGLFLLSYEILYNVDRKFYYEKSIEELFKKYNADISNS